MQAIFIEQMLHLSLALSHTYNQSIKLINKGFDSPTNDSNVDAKSDKEISHRLSYLQVYQ
jgi:hypothetical protein